MKNQEDLFYAAGETIEYARQYIEQQGELLRLEAAERLAKVTSALVTFILLSFFASLVVIMLSIAIAFWLGHLLGSYALAFLIISALYGTLGLLLFFYRRTLITNTVLGIVLNAFFEKD